jgi:hypothetical protein
VEEVKEAEKVKTRDDGGSVRDLDTATARWKEVKKMPGRDDGGSNRRSMGKGDGLEEAKEVPERVDGGNARLLIKLGALFARLEKTRVQNEKAEKTRVQNAMAEEANAEEAKLKAEVEETKAGIALAKKAARRGRERELELELGTTPASSINEIEIGEASA